MNRISKIERFVVASVKVCQIKVNGLDKAFLEINYIYEEILLLIVGDASEWEDWFFNLDTEILLKSSAARSICDNEDKSSACSHCSRSSKGSRSSVSSTRSLMRDEEAQLASLKFELEFAHKRGVRESELMLIEEKVAKKEAVIFTRFRVSFSIHDLFFLS